MKFKVGDRVKSYAFGHLFRVKGTVMGVGGNGLTIKLDDGNTIYCDQKACRLLKKKERRRVWLSIKRSQYEWPGISFSAKDGWIEFIEVKK